MLPSYDGEGTPVMFVEPHGRAAVCDSAFHVADEQNQNFTAPSDHWALDTPRPIAVVGVKTSLATLKETNVHHHRKAQLILPLSGVVTCEVDKSLWIVPPRCAVWISGSLPHSLKASGMVKICCLFVEPEAAANLPEGCCTVSVSPLLRELLLRAVSFPRLYDVDGPDGRVAKVLLDELAVAPVEMLNFPMPSDPRLRKIANAMLADPSERLTISEWGRWAGTSERTLARLLQRDAGMSFGRWRQQMHVLLALQRLAEGLAVQTVAADLGYESASAFINMFRKMLGKPPARYLADQRSGNVCDEIRL